VAEDREVLAHHEAGHAVIAHFLGIVVERVTIQSDGRAAGHVEHDYGCNMNKMAHADGPKRQWVLERKAIIALAGEVAQRRFNAESVEDEHGGGDRLAVDQVLSHLVGPGDLELRNAWHNVLLLRTERLVAEHWSAIDWLAKLLLKRTTIEKPEEIQEAIADALLPLEHRGKRLSFSDRLALAETKPLKRR
jgi:hypothetical protein